VLGAFELLTDSACTEAEIAGGMIVIAPSVLPAVRGRMEPLPVWSERAVSGDLAWQEFRHRRRRRGA